MPKASMTRSSERIANNTQKARPDVKPKPKKREKPEADMEKGEEEAEEEMKNNNVEGMDVVESHGEAVEEKVERDTSKAIEYTVEGDSKVVITAKTRFMRSSTQFVNRQEPSQTHPHEPLLTYAQTYAHHQRAIDHLKKNIPSSLPASFTAHPLLNKLLRTLKVIRSRILLEDKKVMRVGESVPSQLPISVVVPDFILPLYNAVRKELGMGGKVKEVTAHTQGHGISPCWSIPRYIFVLGTAISTINEIVSYYADSGPPEELDAADMLDSSMTELILWKNRVCSWEYSDVRVMWPNDERSGGKGMGPRSFLYPYQFFFGGPQCLKEDEIVTYTILEARKKEKGKRSGKVGKSRA